MAILKDLFSKITELPAEPEKPEPPPRDHIVVAAWKAKERFDRFNRDRRALLRGQIGERAYQAVCALPFLLHTNCDGLPGHVESAACPAGITGYDAPASDMELMAKLFPKADIRRQPVYKMAIDLVAVMGSAGSMGFTESSDLDIWVSFRLSEFGLLSLDILRQKAARIEEWMVRHSGVEVHLFVQPTEHIRDNNFGKTDIEGCGSALGALLKEEFYRTAIVIAGRPPLWWVMPPGLGADSYQALATHLRDAPGFDSETFVDLGPVHQAVLGELFGAAIWQIAKGQKSPFKSALKMGYLEKTVCVGNSSVPLCEALKEKVIHGGDPDPYRLLFDEVLSYYNGMSDLAAQELLAECFYLKTGACLDPDLPDSSASGEAEQVLREYVLKWGWGRRKIRRLNDFRRWRFEWLKELSNDIDRFFLRSYKRIYDALAEAGMAHAITDRDLTVIGRTLQVAYRQSPTKMARIHLLAGGLREPVLSLIEALLPSGDVEWRLYRGVVNALTEDESASSLISSFSDVTELMVWAAYNGVLGPKTRLLCKPVDRRFSSADLESVAELLVGFLAEGDLDSHEVEKLLEDPLPIRLFTVVNLGSEENDIVDVSALYQTTWGETFYRRFTGSGAYREFVEEILCEFWQKAPNPNRITVYAPRRKVSALTSPGARLQKSVAKMAAMFGGAFAPERELRRQITPTAEGFTAIELEAKGFSIRNLVSQQALMRYLCGVGPWNQIVTRVEEDNERLADVALMYVTAEKGRINVFVVERAKLPELFVVDEVGNLFAAVCDDVNPAYTLSKLLIFLEASLEEIRSQPLNPLGMVAPAECVKIFRLSAEPSLRVYPATNDFKAKVKELGLKPMGLTIQKTPGEAGGPSGYKITWGSEVIRSGEVAYPLEELKRRIRDSRASERDYGVYVTKLFLDEQFVRKNCGSFTATGHYLFYKSLIEQRLNS